MFKGKFSITFILAVVASIFTILNGLLIVMSNTPIILSSFPVASVEDAMNANRFWGRIVFGIPGLVENSVALFWLIFAFGMLLSAFLIYMRPRRYRMGSFLITLFSLLCIPIGGGFYFGTILGLIGGLTGFEEHKPFKETFLGRLIGGVTLDSKLYTTIRDKPATLRTAVLAVIIVGFLRGIGNGLYTNNLNLIKTGGDAASRILLDGQVVWNSTAIFTAISLIGITVLEWLVLSVVIYWIGVKLTGISLEYDKVVRVLAFAFLPIGLQVLAPLMFSNEPTLSFNWPFGLYLVSRLWILIALVAAITQTFEFARLKAFGIVILGGMIYWIVDNVFIIPQLNVPGIIIVLSAAESSVFILMSMSAATIIAALLGVFAKK